MRNNPYILGLLIVLSIFLYIDEKKQNPGKTKFIPKSKTKLGVKPLLLKDSFHAHDYDETSRSLIVDGPIGKEYGCSFNKGRSYFKCKVGEKIKWGISAYRKGLELTIKDSFGPDISFSPKTYNPHISFHTCDRYLKKGTSELTLRNALKNIGDKNNDGSQVLCLQSDQKILLRDGPLVVNKDVAIIGTHNKSPVITSLGHFPVFKNDSHTLFLYNLKLMTGSDGSHGVTLGVGSYLGADNLNILVSSQKSEGIHCFGCTIDGDRVEVTTLAQNSKAISASLGLLELRWAKLIVNGENSIALNSDMGTFTNILEDSTLISNETGSALEVKESGLYFNTGTVEQNGMGVAIFLSDLNKYKNEFNSLEVKSRSIAFMIKNAKNIFLKDIVINAKGARMVDLGSDRISQN